MTTTALMTLSSLSTSTVRWIKLIGKTRNRFSGAINPNEKAEINLFGKLAKTDVCVHNVFYFNSDLFPTLSLSLLQYLEPHFFPKIFSVVLGVDFKEWKTPIQIHHFIIFVIN